MGGELKGLRVISTTRPEHAVIDAQSEGALRTRVGWLCHLIRAVSVLWAGWILFVILRNWSDLPRLRRLLEQGANLDLSDASTHQYAAAFAFNVAAWLPDAAVSYCLWRLFGGYLNGRIFTPDAALWMLRLGLCGLAAIGVAVIGRAAIWLTMAGHLDQPFAVLWRVQLVIPNDLLQVLFCLFVIAVAYVFRTAAAIADDHAHIV